MTTAKKNNTVGRDLTSGPVMSSLLRFSGPIILTNLIQQLYSMVDLLVIGHFVGSIGTVGVATGGEIADLIASVAMGFGTAGQIYVAQLFGAKKMDQVKKSVGTLLTLSLLVAMVCTIATIVFSNAILNALNCPAEAFEQARNYQVITALGMPFIFGYNAVVGVLRGMGESKKPLYFISIAGAINVVMDVFLVTVIPLASAGTAIATVLSQAGSFIAAFYYMYRHKEHFDFELKLSYFKMDKVALKVLVKLGVPQVVRSMLVRLSMLWVNANINSYGLTVSATNSVGNKINKFLEVFMQGVDTASGAMVGQNLGAKKPERAKEVIWKALICCLCVATVYAGCALVMPKAIFGIFTTDSEVIGMSGVYMSIMIMHFYMSAITSTFQSMITGCGYVSLGFAIGILDGVICRIGFSLLFVNVLNFGYTGYWWGTAFARTLPGLFCFLYFMSGKWRTRKLLTEES